MYDKWYIVVIYTVYAVWYLVHYIYICICLCRLILFSYLKQYSVLLVRYRNLAQKRITETNGDSLRCIASLLTNNYSTLIHSMTNLINTSCDSN